MMMPTIGSINLKCSPEVQEAQNPKTCAREGQCRAKANAAHKCQLSEKHLRATKVAMIDRTTDRAAITELVAAYGDAVSRRDAQAWGTTWASGATWNLMGHEVSGRDAITALWLGAMAQFDAVSFVTAIGPIRFDGDGASARCQTQEVLRGTDGGIRRVAGVYDDEFVREAGEWCFARRVFAIVIEH